MTLAILKRSTRDSRPKGSRPGRLPQHRRLLEDTLSCADSCIAKEPLCEGTKDVSLSDQALMLGARLAQEICRVRGICHGLSHLRPNRQFEWASPNQEG